MKTPWMRSTSAWCRAAGWLCAAALLLTLVPTQAEEPPARGPGHEDRSKAGPPGNQDSSQENADAEATNEGSKANDSNDPEPVPTAVEDPGDALEECACVLAEGDGGCRSLCNQNESAGSKPNYCDGVTASPECWACVKEKCGVELPK